MRTASDADYTMLDDAFILSRHLRLKIDLVPGPPHNDKALYNKAIQVIARYPAADFANVVSKLPAVRITTDGTDDPRAWKWIWRIEDRVIRFGCTVMGGKIDKDLAWGGSTLDCDCAVGDVLDFWESLRRTHTDTWLHYDGRVYTPTGLVEKLHEMLNAQVITDIV